jgi:L-2-amino-thiazoline-4-carboxylic acid hydrolase
MHETSKGPGKDRREFLHKAAGSVAGAALVTILPAAEAQTAGSKPCSAAEVEELKKKLHDTQFSSAVSIARHLQKLQEKFGSGVLEVVKNTMIENAKQDMARSPIPKEQRNLDAVRALYKSFPEDVTSTWIEDRSDRLKARVTRCRWAEEFKKAGVPGEIGFALVCSYDYGYCAGLNPEMKFSRTKTMMQGDDHCDHTYELKA